MVVRTDVLVDLALVAVAVVGLWYGALQFVRGAGRIARRLRLPGLVVGLTVVAFGTSAPEFAVTLDAALAAKSDISVANVVGSNVVNLGFILGGVALVRELPTSQDLVRRDSVTLLGATVLVFALLWDLRLSRLEGGLLLALLAAYLFVLVRTGSGSLRPEERAPVAFQWTDVVRLVGGLAIVVAGAHLLVLAASNLARDAGVSEWAIGVTIVAAGTSMPEFATSMVAVRRGRTGISAGNLVGSCVFNFLGVLGLAALVRPLPVANTAIESMAWLLGIVLVVTVLFWSRNVLSRLEGGLLVGLNAINWVVDFLP
ncbi:calcium/sodium antiporter [Haloarchaeobius sp. HRN-SO-5]|uniref:calcium/sodium antiporter n=1 Tax=Haloarchaeobius sp. HRN-SO-5 TaxID=3446118 RepID=UPI003EBDECDA